MDDKSAWEPEFYEDHIYPVLEAVQQMKTTATSYPNYPHKHAERAYVLPEQVFEMTKRRAEGPLAPPPEAAILCYQRSLWEAICADTEGTTLGMFGTRLLREADNKIGVTGGFGIGAPAACIQLEALIAYGVKRFVSIGTAGALQEDLDIGDYVVCDRAIRDEGTSYHYLPGEKYAHASPDMVAQLTQAMEKLNLAYRLGTSWTIDAPYRETVAEIRRYRQEGVTTVEMEASALFAVGACRGVEMGAMFTISDLLSGPEWNPHFGSEKVSNALHTLYEAAVEGLRASLT
jgi:uridine phosphorylase